MVKYEKWWNLSQRLRKNVGKAKQVYSLRASKRFVTYRFNHVVEVLEWCVFVLLVFSIRETHLQKNDPQSNWPWRNHPGNYCTILGVANYVGVTITASTARIQNNLQWQSFRASEYENVGFMSLRSIGSFVYWTVSHIYHYSDALQHTPKPILFSVPADRKLGYNASA